MRSYTAPYLHLLLSVFFVTQALASQPDVLSIPGDESPVEVIPHLRILNIPDIHDEDEILAFSGVLTLKWNDPRQRFTPDEYTGTVKTYSGNYQFNELSPGWYPQAIIVNATEAPEATSVILKIQPDGWCTLSQNITASVKTHLDMSAYPLDKQKADIIFEILGYRAHEAVYSASVESVTMDPMMMAIPQWNIPDAHARSGISKPSSPNELPSSYYTVTIDLERRPLFAFRLVVLPLALIVALSWSVFWMERSSLGDRMAVSFVGILTAVSYQVIIGDKLPSISYFTLMNAFLLFSFIQMCLTVLLNLIVSAYDKRGDYHKGNVIDYHCRWIFPASFIAMIAIISIYFL